MTTIPIDAALLDRRLLGAALGEPSSWATWTAVLKAAHGGKLTRQQRVLFDQVAGGRAPPTKRVRELVVIVGRGGGKSRMAGAVSSYTGTCLDHTGKLAPGEVGMILTLSASKSQADVVHGYAEAFITSSPVLRHRVREVTADEIRLTGNVVIATHTNSFRTVRGRSLLCCVFDEAAFWRDESSSNPDREVYTAVLPMLVRTGGMLVIISSPYRKLGLVHQKHRDHFGQEDPNVLVVQGGTTTFNPVIDEEAIAAARLADPAAALSEWDAEFRADLQSYLDDATIDAAVDHGRPLELPPRRGIIYFAFTDASAGRHDAFTICICHREGERVVVDVIRGRKPPFDPATVAAEFAALARDYRCARITGDNFAAEWVAGAFTKAGLPYVRSDAPRSEIYLACLALWMRGIVSIPNHTQMVRELRLLERRTHRSGRDSVDHGAHGSDDYANALSGALRLAAGKRQPLVIPQAAMERAARKPVRWPTIGPGPRLHLNW